MRGKSKHVMLNVEGRWSVRQSGSGQAARTFVTKEEAVTYAPAPPPGGRRRTSMSTGATGPSGRRTATARIPGRCGPESAEDGSRYVKTLPVAERMDCMTTWIATHRATTGPSTHRS